MKLVINTCYGGFGLSDEAYEKLIEWGIPVRKYKDQKRDPNEGEVIFDSDLDKDPSVISITLREISGRYWENWIDHTNRNHPLLVRVVEELGSEKASCLFSKLKVIEIPDGIEFEIDDYDGREQVNETHRSWS